MDIPWLSFPPASLRESIMPEEWQICLDSWLLLAQNSLLLSAKAFSLQATESSSLVQFLVSYAKNYSEPANAKETDLRRKCFLLTHRTESEVRPTPEVLLDWAFLADLGRVYVKSTVLSKLLVDVWRRETLDERLSMRTHKANLILELEQNVSSGGSEELLASVMALMRACYRYGQFLMLGSDLIDALSTAYKNSTAKNPKQKIVALTYFCLVSLLEPDQPRISTLLDHLYGLKATTSDDSLLKAIVESTPLLAKIRTRTAGPESARAKSLVASLSAFEKLPDGRPKKPVRRKVDKGKRKDADQHGPDATGGLPVHKLSLVTQVQDLFPDLGSAFVVSLLDEYADDAEQATAHLLDDSLPPHLNALDRTAPLPPAAPQPPNDLAPGLEPHPPRRNIHDDDALDRLAVPASALARGRRDHHDSLSSSSSSPPAPAQKAAILSALAAFDSDDDERDDTYDAQDVGGTVDTVTADHADEEEAKHEEALWHAYGAEPDVFGRDAATRRGGARAALKRETGMTDEALEGWAIMVRRDPRRLRRLERRYEMGAGGGGGAGRTPLGRSAWGADSGAEEGREDGGSDVGGGDRDGGGGGRGRGRGRGTGRGTGGGGGGGASVAGPSDDKKTQAARQRKDANKGSRANHNRRDQRARKMARGGLMG